MEQKFEIVNRIKKYLSESFVVVAIAAIYNKISTLKGTYKLYRHNDIDKLGNVVILSSPEIFNKRANQDNLKKQKDKYQIEIDKFVKNMEDNLSFDNLITMYNNLNRLKIGSSDFTLLFVTFLIQVKLGSTKGVAGGGYSPNSNSINLYSKFGSWCSQKIFKHNTDVSKMDSTIFSHELLHMSSSIKKKNKMASGFSQHYSVLPVLSIYDFGIGNALNEGYTELLNQRFFGSNIRGIYAVYREIAKIIENVVGSDKMTNLYFKSDLPGLIKELNNYIPEIDTKRFILLFDRINNKNIDNILEYITRLAESKIDKDYLINLDEDTAIKQYTDLRNRIKNIKNIYTTEVLGTSINKDNTDKPLSR